MQNPHNNDGAVAGEGARGGAGAGAALAPLLLL